MLHRVDLHPEEGVAWVNWGKQTMSVWLIPAPRLSNIKRGILSQIFTEEPLSGGSMTG